MKTPVFEILRRIRPLAPIHKVDHLRRLIAVESPRSIRRQELEFALRDVITKQLIKERKSA